MDIFQVVTAAAKTVTESSSPWDHWEAIAEIAKGFAEAFAFLATGGFFLYKMLSGYLISNLSLAVSCERRQPPNTSGDYLVVTALVKKGDRGAVTLHDAEARVSNPMPNEKSSKKLAGITRLTYKESDGILSIGEAQSQKTPLLNLPPGEETMFSAFFEIQRDLPCVVEVIVLGGWRWHGRTAYQWRASQVSLPPKAESEEAHVAKAGN